MGANNQAFAERRLTHWFFGVDQYCATGRFQSNVGAKACDECPVGQFTLLLPIRFLRRVWLAPLGCLRIHFVYAVAYADSVRLPTHLRNALRMSGLIVMILASLARPIEQVPLHLAKAAANAQPALWASSNSATPNARSARSVTGWV